MKRRSQTESYTMGFCGRSFTVKQFELTPSPATPQEIIADLRRQGIVEMAEAGSPTVFPDEKIRVGTGGPQAALWGERQRNLFDGGTEQ